MFASLDIHSRWPLENLFKSVREICIERAVKRESKFHIRNTGRHRPRFASTQRSAPWQRVGNPSFLVSRYRFGIFFQPTWNFCFVRVPIVLLVDCVCFRPLILWLVSVVFSKGRSSGTATVYANKDALPHRPPAFSYLAHVQPTQHAGIFFYWLQARQIERELGEHFLLRRDLVCSFRFFFLLPSSFERQLLTGLSNARSKSWFLGLFG